MKSSTALEQCPAPSMPELAVIGRSNVGKSSLVNALTNQASLAKVSKTPGLRVVSPCDCQPPCHVVERETHAHGSAGPYGGDSCLLLLGPSRT